MKLINSKVELIPQFDLFKHIELAGRTCYKSEDKITDDSASAFVGRIINSKHLSVLEHGTVYLTYHLDKEETGDFDPYKYIHNPYSRVNIVNNEDGSNDFYITTNYRVIVENNWEADMRYQTEPSSKHIARYTFRFTCSRAIANEIVRHRVMSSLKNHRDIATIIRINLVILLPTLYQSNLINYLWVIIFIGMVIGVML